MVPIYRRLPYNVHDMHLFPWLKKWKRVSSPGRAELVLVLVLVLVLFSVRHTCDTLYHN